MPTKPYVFETKTQLVGKLRQQKTRNGAEAFFSARHDTVYDAVKASIGGNTFRAFRNLPIPPSVAFRCWATDYIERSLNALKQLAAANDAAAYAQYLHTATQSLCDYWHERTGATIGYGRAAKLFNLVVKRIACLRMLDGHRQNLIGLLHVPLDSYTIVGLRRIAPELAIRANATMKDIRTPQQYEAFENRIGTIAREANVPPIYYDILAWDMSHQ